MQLQLFFILSLIVLSAAIKVPVEDKEENVTDEQPVNISQQEQNNPTYYASDDTNLDSYLVPPDPHRPQEVPPNIVAPASYLLPPTPEKQTDYYYNPTEPGEQTDWYPISQVIPPQQQVQAIPIFQLSPNQSEAWYVLENTRRGKAYEKDGNIVPIPSVRLEPPLANAPDDYAKSSSTQFVQPSEDIGQPINISPKASYELPFLRAQNNEAPQNYRPIPVEPTLAVHLIPPQPQLLKHKIATKLYPKKFTGFKPVPIPIAQFADDSLLEVPRAKPVKYFKPFSSTEVDYLSPSDEKVNYLYRIAEQKRKLKEDEIGQEPQQADIAVDTYGKPISTEQETSATNYRHPGRNVYPAPLRQAPPAAPQQDAAPAPDERTEFRMHGMKGPHSYQFGYDTGKGKNRQFRYEERDNDGQVRGHYGYMDKHGKLRVVNYKAHPELGFQAETPPEKE